MKKVVLISVGQPSTNPRLVKEANALTEKGFDVYVVYSYWSKWASDADKVILSKVAWKAFLAGGSPFELKFRYLFTRLRSKIFSLIAKYVTLKFGIAEVARGRTYPELLKKAKALKADLYIAHVQAALPVAVKAAKKYNAKCGFDAEDFHREEIQKQHNRYNYNISKYLEDKYLPMVDYITASSPLIAEQYASLYNRKVTVIQNVFPVDSDILKPTINNKKSIKLFWFSQTIGPGRGIEVVLNALQLLKDYAFELHLLGDVSAEAKTLFTDTGQVKIELHLPMAPNEIISFASQFDIGLASENSVPLNRDICLTNKIFTYMQAGLAIVASDTKAQVKLLDEYPTIGKIYLKDDPRSLADILLDYNLNRGKLLETREASLVVAQQKLNWEIEQKKFLSVVENTLNNH